MFDVDCTTFLDDKTGHVLRAWVGFLFDLQIGDGCDERLRLPRG